MIRAVGKELRGVAAWTRMVALVLGAVFVADAVIGDPHLAPLASRWSALLDALTAAAPYIVACAVGQQLLTREFDEQTIRFLDALPGGRRRAFVAKLTTAVLVIGAWPVGHVGLTALLDALSRDSVASPAPAVLLTLVALSGLHATVLAAWALLAGWLRGSAWALLLFASLAVDAHPWHPLVRRLNPQSLLAVVVDGDGLRLPWEPVATQAAIAALLIAVDWLIFRFLPPSPVDVGPGVWRQLTTRWFPVVGGVVGGIAALAASEPTRRDRADSDRYRTWRRTTVHTARYAFRVDTEREHGLDALIEQADDVDASVRALLGAEPGDEITVMVGESGQRTHGTAYWNSIRLDSSAAAGRGPDLLTHETAHVYVSRLSEGRMEVSLLHEGIAEYAEQRLVEGGIGATVRWSALIARTNTIPFDTLLDRPALAADWDADLVYPHGASFVDTWVSREGEASLGAVLRAYPQVDGGTANDRMWAAFHAAGVNLEGLIDAWEVRLARVAAENRRRWGPVPRLEGRLEIDAENVAIELTEVLAAPACRFRVDPDDPPYDYVEDVRFVDGRCVVARERLHTEGAFGWQVGYTGPVGGITWGRWNTGRLPE